MEPLTPDWLNLPVEPDGHDCRDVKELRKLLRQSEQREARLKRRIKFFEQERDAERIRIRAHIASARVAQVAKKMKPTRKESAQ
jgi:phage shock protein A